MNLYNQSPKEKIPATLILRLKCLSKKDAAGMRQILIETLKEFSYKRRDCEFKIIDKMSKNNP